MLWFAHKNIDGVFLCFKIAICSYKIMKEREDWQPEEEKDYVSTVVWVWYLCLCFPNLVTRCK